MFQINYHPTPTWWGYPKKESVELIFDYLTEGCSKTFESNKRRDTPHLNRMRYAPMRHSYIYTRSSAIR